jgi:hypothetical protein
VSFPSYPEMLESLNTWGAAHYFPKPFFSPLGFSMKASKNRPIQGSVLQGV